MKSLVAFLTAGLFAVPGSVCAQVSTLALHTTRLTERGTSVANADIVLKNFDGSERQRHLRVGEVLPDNVQISVPTGDTITISYASVKGRGLLILGSGSNATLSYTGAVEIVAVRPGTVASIPQDPMDFFSVSGQGVYASGMGTAYSFVVTNTGIIVTCTDGSVRATLSGGGVAGPGAPSILAFAETSFAKRVDSISPGGRSEIAYRVGSEATADVTLADDRARAERGNAEAEYNLGSRYALGRGVPRDDAMALRWYRLSASQVDANAENTIGYMYDLGHGVSRNYSLALRWYRLAAAHGNADAESNIGAMDLLGQGVPNDVAQARGYFERAANKGSTAGQNNLGLVYELLGALGSPNDYATALHYFALAAERGSMSSRNALGNMYENGNGTAVDYARAVGYYELTAADGNAYGEYHLGTMYERGLGVAKSDSAALHYYELAANQKFSRALYDAQRMRDALNAQKGVQR